MNASSVSLILSFIFLGLLIIGFFIGFWRGVKKSALNLAFSIVAMVIAFFITPVVTNAILNININFEGESVSLNQYFVMLLKENQEVANMIENNPEIETLIEKLPSALANVVLFIVLSLLVSLVTYIFYKIIAVICLKKKENENQHRVWGGVIGIVKTFIFAVFTFMPLSSLVGLFNEIKEKEDIYKDNASAVSVVDLNSSNQSNYQENEQGEGNLSAIAQMIPQEVIDIFDGLNNNVFLKICSFGGLNNAMFDYLGQVEIDGEKLLIREEISSYAKAYDISVQLSNISSTNYNFSDLDFDKIEPYLDNILDGTLFRKVVVNTLQEFIVNYQNYPFISENEALKDYLPVLDKAGDTLENLLLQSSEAVINYFKNDIKSLFDIFQKLADNGIVDEIIQLSNATTEQIVDILTSDKNLNVLNEVLKDLFNMNILRDGFDIVLNNVLPSILEGVENIVVDTSSWVEENWQELLNQINTTVTAFAKVSQNIDVSKVINDPTSLLDSNSLVDLDETLTSLGEFVDSVLDISILKNEKGESVFANLLKENNIVLPADEVIKNNGDKIKIQNYKEYFSFIYQSLNAIKENDLFNILSNSSDAKQTIKSIANIVSIKGNEELLTEIFMPLYQIEPTKTLIVDLLKDSVQSDFIDLSSINTYDDWKNELNLISQLLTTLNQVDANDINYLDYVLNGNIDDLLVNLGDNITITQIIEPVLYSKSITGIKEKLFDSIENVLSELANENIVLDISNVTFDKDNTEDQTGEVCKIFENFLSIYKDYLSLENGQEFSFNNINKEKLGDLLDSLKENAYRVEMYKKGEIGLFKNAFDLLYNNMTSSFENLSSIIGDKALYEISFAEIMGILQDFENASEGTFIKEISNVIGSENIDIATISNILDTITADTNQEEINSLLTVLYKYNVKIEIPQEYQESALNVINNKDILTDETKEQLKKLLGLIKV